MKSSSTLKEFVWLMFKIAVMVLAAVGLDTVLKSGGDLSIDEHLKSLEAQINQLESYPNSSVRIMVCLYTEKGVLVPGADVTNAKIELTTYAGVCPKLVGDRTTLRIL